MKLNLENENGLLTVDLNRLATILQPAAHVPYAPPHVFPMSTPKFLSLPKATRPNPPTEPLGVYVHVPFCEYACNFCFYVKQIGADRTVMERYVRALQHEFTWLPKDIGVRQLYVGGGTPTALPSDLLNSLLEAVLGRIQCEKESVFTVECSPETLTPDHISALNEHHVRRASLGIQTLNEDVLGKLNRRHGSKEALNACERLMASGRMVNVDLIYGLPGQTEEMFRKDFEELAKRGVHSINAYNLRVNEHTPVLKLLREDERLELAQLIRWRAFVQRTALELGYRQKHWQRFMHPDTTFELDLTSDNLFGAGVSARSFLDSTVYRNHSSLTGYLKRIEKGISPVEEVFTLDEQHRKTYFITRTLGSGKTLIRKSYEQAFRCSVDDDYGSICQRLVENGLIEDVEGQITLTSIGKLVYDLVTLAFYPRYLQEWLESRHKLALARRTGVKVDNPH